MAESVLRLLRVLELLAAAPERGLSAADLGTQASMASSTLYRLVADLERAGYVFRSADRNLHANFSFEQRIASNDFSPLALRDACATVSTTLESASEIIVPRRQHLHWLVTDEHPRQAIRLRAHPGFLRGTYELDSISRLALSFRPLDEIERDWDTSAFHEPGVARRPVDWSTARAMIGATDRDDMTFDMLGNAKGVRRFSIAVADPGADPGRALVCLLTVAEAATPVRDEAAHLARIRDVLMRARNDLLAAPQPELARA